MQQQNIPISSLVDMYERGDCGCLMFSALRLARFNGGYESAFATLQHRVLRCEF